MPKYQHEDGTVYTVSGDAEVERFEASEKFTLVDDDAVSPAPPVIEYGEQQGDQPIAVEVMTEPLQQEPAEPVHTPEPILAPGDNTAADDVSAVTSGDDAVPNKADSGDPVPDETWKNADIQDWLDLQGKPYTKGATKSDLLDSARA